MKHPPTTEHNYLPKVLELGQKLKDFPGFQHVLVFHDYWCDAYDGGFCNCDPEVKLKADA